MVTVVVLDGMGMLVDTHFFFDMPVLLSGRGVPLTPVPLGPVTFVTLLSPLPCAIVRIHRPMSLATTLLPSTPSSLSMDPRMVVP